MWPMEYAIVSTVRPKASETPSKPIPTCGNPAAMTAEPQPANVSQNVPIASATYFLIWSIVCSSHLSREDCHLVLVIVVVFVLRLQTAAFCSISHFAKDIHLEEAQPGFLVVVKARIERLPRIGELFQVGRSCRQGIGAITQKLDRIELTLASGPGDQIYQALPPGHCSDTDRLLHSRPVFRLVRGQLQSKPDELNAPIRNRLELGITEALLCRSSLGGSRTLCRSSRNLCIGERRRRDEEGTQSGNDGL